MLQKRILAPVASCPISSGALSGTQLERQDFEYWPRVDNLDRIVDNDNPGMYPSYAPGINAARPLKRVITQRADTGSFETTYDQMDAYSFAQLTRESLHGASSTATSARHWLTRQDHRPVAFLVAPNRTQIGVYWLAPAETTIDLKYSLNGGPEQTVLANGTNQNPYGGLPQTFARVANGSYVVRLYPAGQSAPIAEVSIGPGDASLKSFSQWLIGLEKSRCLVGSDAAACATVAGVAQATVREFDPLGNLLSVTGHGVTARYS